VPFKPQAFGKYFLVDKIATGGMAEIFKAKTYSHGGFEHLLVIKRILSHLGENSEFIEMFIDEAKISVALQHPNIIRIYDFGKILDNYFIAMECVDGKDVRGMLREQARQQKIMPVDFAVAIALQACNGLHYAHAKVDLQGNPYDIVHRDISPSNLLISYEGDVKVADFGIAKAESNIYETQDGVLKGKYEYMSPEQAQGRPLDPRSDVFSLGIVFHEMLTGRRLFKTGNDMETLRKIRDVDVEKPSTKNPDVSEELDRIVMKALAQKPWERYASADEMAVDLRAELQPSDPDSLRRPLSDYMNELFADDIAQERSRLEHGSSLARQFRDALPQDNWDGQTDSRITTMSTRSIPRPPRVWPFLLVGAVLILVCAIGLGVVGVVVSEMNVVVPTPIAVAPRPAELVIQVRPAGLVSIDDVQRGTHDVLTVNDLAAGSHIVAVEAEGFERYQRVVQLAAGEKLRIDVALTKIVVEQPTPEPGGTPPVVPRPANQTVGTVAIGLAAGGWGMVYIDGKKHTKTAPVSVRLPAGEHTIRVENPALGLNFEQKVKVAAGEMVAVTAK
jgi:serine/threonine protein kinase